MKRPNLKGIEYVVDGKFVWIRTEEPIPKKS